MKERITDIMKHENLSPSAFAESIGIQRSALSHILNGRNNPSLDVVMRIHQTYKYVNLQWLLYGDGEMIEGEKKKESIQQPSLFDDNGVNVANNPRVSEFRKEIASIAIENVPKEVVREEVRYIEKPHRKITEIRIFFDDNTYEIFKGEK